MIQYLGQKILFQRIVQNIEFTDISEAFVWEISPNELYVKLDGKWYEIAQVKVLDVLDQRYQ